MGVGVFKRALIFGKVKNKCSGWDLNPNYTASKADVLPLHYPSVCAL